MSSSENTTVRRGVPLDPVHWAEVTGYSAGYHGKAATTCTLIDAAELEAWVRGYLTGWRSAKAHGRLPPPPPATRAGANWLLVDDQVLEQGIRANVAQVDLGAMLSRPPGAIKVEASRRGLTPRRGARAAA